MLLFLTEIKSNFINLKLSERLYLFLIFIDSFLLILFGKEYSKLEVIYHLHLHDVFYILIFIFSLFFSYKIRFRLIELLITISIIYLIISLFFHINKENALYFTIRQFMIYGYIAITYFIIRPIFSFKKGFSLAIQLVFLIGSTAFLSQIIFLTYNIINGDYQPFFGRHALSPSSVEVGTIIVCAFSLAYLSGFKRHIVFLFVLFLSTSAGKDSAYLSIIVIYLCFFLLESPMLNKLIIFFLFLVGLLLIIIFVPTFTDVNMTWRLIFWKETLLSLWQTNDIYFGRGFGIHYLDHNTRNILNNLMKSRGENVIIDNEEMYYITSHNSFITILQHLGLFNFLLILPFFRYLKIYINLTKSNIEIISLLLCLIGFSVWAFFNLILELPHSASLYWIIFFVFTFSLKFKKNISNNL